MLIEIPEAQYEYSGKSFDSLASLFDYLMQEMMGLHDIYSPDIDCRLRRSVFRHMRGGYDNGREIIVILHLWRDNNNGLHIQNYIGYLIEFSDNDRPFINI